MNWQPAVYCLSFGTLTASIVAGVFTPFCRGRQSAPEGLFTAAPPTEPKVERKKDRVSHAMRQWTDVRADADLAFTTPAPASEERKWRK
jgi:hypothetical protein